MDDLQTVQIWREIEQYVHARDFIGLYTYCFYTALQNPQLCSRQNPLPDIS